MTIVSKLIENAIKKGTIKQNKLVVEDYEDDEFVIIHKGIHIPIDNISILSYENIFLYILKHKKIKYLFIFHLKMKNYLKKLVFLMKNKVYLLYQ